MTCALCGKWSPEYRETCCFCRGVFPRSLELERSKARLAAEYRERVAEANRAAAAEATITLELGRRPLEFGKRRELKIMREWAGSSCLYAEGRILFHCRFLTVECDHRAVAIGLLDLQSPGFCAPALAPHDFTVGSPWHRLSRSSNGLSAFELWEIVCDPEIVGAVKRAAEDLRHVPYPERLPVLRRVRSGIELERLSPPGPS